MPPLRAATDFRPMEDYMSTNSAYLFNPAWASAFISLAASVAAIYTLIRFRAHDPKTTVYGLFFALNMMIVAVIMEAVSKYLIYVLGNKTHTYINTSIELTLLCFLATSILGVWSVHTAFNRTYLSALTLFTATICTATVAGFMYLYMLPDLAQADVRSVTYGLSFCSIAAVIITLMATAYEYRKYRLQCLASESAR